MNLQMNRVKLAGMGLHESKDVRGGKRLDMMAIDHPAHQGICQDHIHITRDLLVEVELLNPAQCEILALVVEDVIECRNPDQATKRIQNYYPFPIR